MNFKLSEADYDFSDVASGLELETCLFYEYSRESNAVRNEIAAARKQFGGKTGQVKFGFRIQNLIQSHVLMGLAIARGFPNTPWQLLSDKDKKILLNYHAQVPHVFRYATTWHNPPLTFATHEPETMSLEAWKKQCRERLPSVPNTDPIKSGFFSVNIKYGRRVLIEEFARWLTSFEGKAMSETSPIENDLAAPKKSPGRKSIHDALNALGAMRLRYYCGIFSDAKNKMLELKDKPRGMFYARRDGFNRACNSALRHFEKQFGWLDQTEKPIHFTEGWRGTPK